MYSPSQDIYITICSYKNKVYMYIFSFYRILTSHAEIKIATGCFCRNKGNVTFDYKYPYYGRRSRHHK